MKSKLLIITGANGQVGSFLARSYAGGSEPLLLLYHKGFQRIGDLRQKGRVILKACDLRSFKETISVIESACREFDAVPARVVHTAALRSYDARSLAESDPEIFYKVLETNLRMAYNTLRACLPGMLAQKFGRVVMFGSNVVATGLKNGAAYAVAKAGIVNLVKSVALETASSDVLINAISPAPIKTELEDDYAGEYLQFRKEYFARYRRLSPTGKLVPRQEIKTFVDLLLSDEIRNYTGANIIIDGGLSTAVSGEIQEEN